MPHSLQIFSDSYKRIDPVFSKRSRHLLRTLEHAKVAARNAAAAGRPGPEMFTVLRELIKSQTAFSEAFKSRTQNLYFPEVDQMLKDLEQLDRLVKHAKGALSNENGEQSLVALVQELI